MIECVDCEEYLREIDRLESALAAEREAHEETRKRLDCAEELAVAARIERDAAESRLAAAEGCLREIDDVVGRYADMEVSEFPHVLIPRVAKLARAFLAGGKTK